MFLPALPPRGRLATSVDCGPAAASSSISSGRWTFERRDDESTTAVRVVRGGVTVDAPMNDVTTASSSRQASARCTARAGGEPRRCAEIRRRAARWAVRGGRRGDSGGGRRRAWDRGIRLYDVAPFYGHGRAERSMGRVLRRNLRRFVLSTRLDASYDRRPPRAVRFVQTEGVGPVFDFSADGVRRSLEESLATTRSRPRRHRAHTRP